MALLTRLVEQSPHVSCPQEKPNIGSPEESSLSRQMGQGCSGVASTALISSILLLASSTTRGGSVSTNTVTLSSVHVASRG